MTERKEKANTPYCPECWGSGLSWQFGKLLNCTNCFPPAKVETSDRTKGIKNGTTRKT